MSLVLAPTGGAVRLPDKAAMRPRTIFIVAADTSNVTALADLLAIDLERELGRLVLSPKLGAVLVAGFFLVAGWAPPPGWRHIKRPRKNPRGQRALATTRIAESPRAKERGERSFIHKPYQGGFLPLKTNAGRLFSGTKNPPFPGL